MRLPKAYNPAEYEENIYALWEKSGAFEPKSGDTTDYYSLVLPPPNANGDLHIGHALTVAIEDALARYHRLQGKPTLYVPGADHAGFETWVVYEKKLAEQGKSRFDYSREELYRQVWDFVQQNKHNFEAQLRALGASVNWSRYTFTLDNKVVATSYETFEKMWHNGLIYRGKRIVNYCTFHGTSFSDIEVVHEEEKTKLWHIAYPLADDSGPKGIGANSNGAREVVIATTRPETKLGQSALMVNPKDVRYKNLIGREVHQPLVPDKPIKIIADEYVDMSFGTGVVTVTPAHDPNDFEVAERHKLPLIELITTEGVMSDNVPEKFRGMTVTKARKAVVKELEKNGLLRSTEEHEHSIGKCYKCGTPIEPLALEQWFVRMRPLAERTISEVAMGKINFYPSSKKAHLIRYLSEVKDWNISRQIPWGIPIPAFQNVDDPEDWIFDARVHKETLDVGTKSYKRDPDVFDTWFSSGQWPYVTLNYPDGDEFKQFYPLSLMETGGEILYQWVARMIMLGLYTTDEVPFKNVYIHGYVLAEDGAKMSKSLGNVVNPMELIKGYGSDALRMGLLTGRRAGVNQGYHPSKILNGRNFANKLWNISRYVEDKVGDEHRLKAQPTPQSAADHWILARIGSTADEIKKAIDSYRLSEAFEQLYHFVWSDLADWYVEASKAAPNKGMLAYALESTLKIAHPFAPFVTETIWQTLAWEQNNLLISQDWPQVPAADPAQVEQFEVVKNIVSEVRWLNAMSGQKAEKLYSGNASDDSELIAKLTGVKVAQAGDNPSGIKLSSIKSGWWLDVEPKAAKEKLEARKAELQKEADSLRRRLDNQDYVAKAPPELVEQTKQQLSEAQSQQARLQQVLDGLN